MHHFMGDEKWRGPSRRLLLLCEWGKGLDEKKEKKKKKKRAEWWWGGGFHHMGQIKLQLADFIVPCLSHTFSEKSF